MITILGAGGVIANELAKGLAARNESVRLVSRNPRSVAGAETAPGDLSRLDSTIAAVKGSEVAVLLVGLKYSLAAWKDRWGCIMYNAIEACRRANAKLVFFDNVYMYGKVKGPMTEDTPFNPCSKKGEVRAQTATALLDEIKAGNVTGMIARSADFYGPGAKNGVANIMVFDKLAKKSKADWLGSDSAKHSFTYTPDAARAIIDLIYSPNAWNQTWHLPTAPDPPAGKDFVALAAKEFGADPKVHVIGKIALKLAGMSDPTAAELSEMMYQYDSDYIFDSSKFTRVFPWQPTSYADGIRATAATYPK